MAYVKIILDCVYLVILFVVQSNVCLTNAFIELLLTHNLKIKGPAIYNFSSFIYYFFYWPFFIKII